MRITCTVNGEQQQADDVWEGESLLYVLRERLGFPGSKNACEQGECGSCSVLLEGELVCACLVLAVQADGHDVVTVEGLGNGDGFRASRSVAATTKPGVQKPHWTAPVVTNASCTRFIRSPSTVTTSWPSACAASTRQEQTS